MNDDLWEDDELDTDELSDEEDNLGLTVVRVGNVHFGMNVRNVAEVLPLRRVTPLFRLPDHVLGVTNLRGKVLPVSELATLVGVQAGNTGDSEQDTNRSAVGLLVEWRGHAAVFAVDAVIAVRWISKQHLVEVPSTTPKEMAQFFVGLMPATPPVTVLAIDRLFDPSLWATRSDLLPSDQVSSPLHIDQVSDHISSRSDLSPPRPPNLGDAT